MMRIATTKDLKDINRLTNIAKSIMEKDNNPQWDERYPKEEDFLNDIHQKNLYLYEFENKVAGYICINQSQADWYGQFSWPANIEKSYVIHRMAADPSVRGVAQKMMTFAIDLARKGESSIMLTDTFSLNSRAQKLFKSFGFQFIGEYETDEFPFDKNAPFYAYYKLLNDKEK